MPSQAAIAADARGWANHAGDGFVRAVLGFIAPPLVLVVVGLTLTAPHLEAQLVRARAELGSYAAAHHAWVVGEAADTQDNGAVVFDQPKPLRLVSALVRRHHAAPREHSRHMAHRHHVRNLRVSRD